MSADAMTVKFLPSLIELQDAINRTTDSLRFLGAAIGGTPIEERCEFSDLFVTQCAHCMGHEPDWETKPKAKVYD